MASIFHDNESLLLITEQEQGGVDQRAPQYAAGEDEAERGQEGGGNAEECREDVCRHHHHLAAVPVGEEPLWSRSPPAEI